MNTCPVTLRRLPATRGTRRAARRSPAPTRRTRLPSPRLANISGMRRRRHQRPRARSDRVRGDAVLHHRVRHRRRERDDPGLRRRVVRLSGRAEERGLGRRVDDAAVDLVARPSRARASTRTAWRIVLKWPLRWTRMTASHSASSMLKSIRSRRMPALLTRMLTSPYRSDRLVDQPLGVVVVGDVAEVRVRLAAGASISRDDLVGRVVARVRAVERDAEVLHDDRRAFASRARAPRRGRARVRRR